MDTSPGWKRPSQLMKIKHKRRASLPNACRIAKKLELCTTESSLTSLRSISIKRCNPFSKDGDHTSRVAKKFCPAEESLLAEMSTRKTSSLSSLHSDNPDVSLLQMLDTNTPDRGDDTHKIQLTQIQGHDSITTLENSEPNKTNNAAENLSTDDIRSAFPACDWSVKNRVRFLSDIPFTWCQNIKSLDQSHGIINFTRCQRNCELPDCMDQYVIANDDLSTFQRYLQQQCSVWQHPNLPWFNSFPRILAHSRVGTVSVINTNDDIVSALHKDWVSSFTSIFQLLRCGLCPYFYMFTHQFSVLFRAAGVAGEDDSHALITPTTRGIREAMKKEGIDFTLPAVTKKRTSNSKSSNSPERTETSVTEEKDLSKDTEQCEGEIEKENKDLVATDKDQSDDDSLDDVDSAASDWLESIGLNKRNYRSLDPHKVKLNKEGFRVIDNRPESVIHVQGLGDLQALFNYLINCRNCVASSGVQAGIPPTILAPIAFTGATLKTLRVRCNKVQSTESRHKQLYTVDVCGPVLPHTLYGLCELFTHTHSHYSMSLSTHEPTTAFNVSAQVEEGSTRKGDVDCDKLGISQGVGEYIRRNSGLDKRGMKELKYDNNLYTWNL